MKEEKQQLYYKFAQQGYIPSKDDLLSFARNVLLDMGVDIDIVNLKEDGITIESFSKFVKAIYLSGFENGLTKNNALKGEKIKLEREGKILNKHQRRARATVERLEYFKS